MNLSAHLGEGQTVASAKAAALGATFAKVSVDTVGGSVAQLAAICGCRFRETASPGIL